MNINILEWTPEQLGEAVVYQGQPAFRAKQICDWIYRKGVTDPQKMTNIPPALRDQLNVLSSKVIQQSQSKDGTIKLLLELHDGEHIETVLIPAAKRATACLSTQVGCALGCSFCASGLDGVKRNLTSGEILEQILHLQLISEQKVTNVVFMGMGEPLLNYDATVAAVRGIIDPQRFGISARKVTVSTIGLPAQIRRLAKEDMQITLAISLHAPNDPLRKQLMPAADQTPLDKIISAAETFYAQHKREITLEYILMGGINDTKICSEALAKIAKKLRCNVNLIKFNPVEGVPYKAPSNVTVKAFAESLKSLGVNVHIRKSKGTDTDAACGQLRKFFSKKISEKE